MPPGPPDIEHMQEEIACGIIPCCPSPPLLPLPLPSPSSAKINLFKVIFFPPSLGRGHLGQVGVGA